MKAVIQAGGKGTRMRSVSTELPKPMIPVLGKPILEYQIESLKRSGITDITLIIGYLGNVIRDYIGDGSKFGVSISYIEEKEPLGTAGALFYFKEESDDFLLVFGDLMLDIDWGRFMDFHKEKDAWITLYGHPNAHPYDSDLLITSDDDEVTGIDSKNNARNYWYHNFVNAGVYAVSPRALKIIEAPQKIDFEKGIIRNLIPQHHIYAYSSSEYVRDMGTPDRYKAVEEDLKNGIVQSRSLRNKQKAVFLDRDGTINKLVGFLRNIDDFELLPTVGDAIRKLNSSEYLTILATNQPVVARGEVTFDELRNIHNKMETLLGKKGAYIDALYFCPHHPDKGFEGEIPELKIDCDCRKPKVGMLTKAAKRFNIDLSGSWYVGDSTMDIQTGKNAGCKTILLQTGAAGKDGKYDVKPDYEAENLEDAVDIIFKGEQLK